MFNQGQKLTVILSNTHTLSCRKRFYLSIVDTQKQVRGDQIHTARKIWRKLWANKGDRVGGGLWMKRGLCYDRRVQVQVGRCWFIVWLNNTFRLRALIGSVFWTWWLSVQQKQSRKGEFFCILRQMEACPKQTVVGGNLPNEQQYPHRPTLNQHCGAFVKESYRAG